MAAPKISEPPPFGAARMSSPSPSPANRSSTFGIPGPTLSPGFVRRRGSTIVGRRKASAVARAVALAAASHTVPNPPSTTVREPAVTK